MVEASINWEHAAVQAFSSAITVERTTIYSHPTRTYYVSQYLMKFIFSLSLFYIYFVVLQITSRYDNWHIHSVEPIPQVVALASGFSQRLSHFGGVNNVGFSPVAESTTIDQGNARSFASNSTRGTRYTHFI